MLTFSTHDFLGSHHLLIISRSRIKFDIARQYVTAKVKNAETKTLKSTKQQNVRLELYIPKMPGTLDIGRDINELTGRQSNAANSNLFTKLPALTRPKRTQVTVEKQKHVHGCHN